NFRFLWLRLSRAGLFVVTSVRPQRTRSTRRFNHKFNYFLCFCALKIIAAIEYPPVIVKILSHLGLPTRAPPRAPARRVDLFQTILGAAKKTPQTNTPRQTPTR